MRWVLVILGVLCALSGIVLILQGMNILLGSPMSGDLFWALVGLLTLVIGLALVYIGGSRMAPRARS